MTKSIKSSSREININIEIREEKKIKQLEKDLIAAEEKIAILTEQLREITEAYEQLKANSTS